MASSYAALVCLMNVVNRVQHPSCPADFNKFQILSLFDKVSLMTDFLETYSKCISKEFERKITDTAYAVQDEIESYVVDRIHEGGNISKLACKRVLINMGGLDQCINLEGMDLIIEEAAEVKQRIGEKNQLPGCSLGVGSSVLPPSGTIKIAGFEEEVNRLLGKLAIDKSGREIIPVVGMAGIGKSTLAVSVFTHPYVRDTFYVKAWVTVSQVYDIGTVFRLLLHELGVSGISDDQLAVELHKYLFGRKYLIVLDDIWDSEAWGMISRFLPDNNNGSRILLTTRLMNVVHSVGSNNLYETQLLDDEKSWELLSRKVFGEQICPSALENCGKEIAKSCKGLPLAIVVTSGILKMSQGNTLEYWVDVAKNLSSIISQEDDQYILKILSLSYHELPIHLRPCFLYLATFPEDHEILVSELTMLWLWAADGFVKPNGDYTLEQVALENLMDLINRNLIMVKKRNSRGNVKSLILHDLVRDLCIKEARTEKFLFVDDAVVDLPKALECQHRLVFHGHGHTFLASMKPEGLARSLVWLRNLNMLPPVSQLRLLSVLSSSYLGNPRQNITKLANLRFLKCSTLKEGNQFTRLFSSGSVLWNLETLIVDIRADNVASIPSQIWKLPRVKHLIFSKFVNFPDPPFDDTDYVFSNLQTLKAVIIFYRVLRKIPNIKDLVIHSYLQELDFGNLVPCLKLETLDFCGKIGLISNQPTLFPSNLKKLTLELCDIYWQNMTVVGSLPNLEMLKLKQDAFIGPVWNSTEGEFQHLKILSIESSDLATWRVEKCSHFPHLEHLILRQMKKFDEIPQVLGDSMTLKSIQLHKCKGSAVISAWQILDEQENMGNYDLTVEAVHPVMASKEEETELNSLTSDRFHIKFWQYSR